VRRMRPAVCAEARPRESSLLHEELCTANLSTGIPQAAKVESEIKEEEIAHGTL